MGVKYLICYIRISNRIIDLESSEEYVDKLIKEKINHPTKVKSEYKKVSSFFERDAIIGNIDLKSNICLILQYRCR